jgi:hypothetical protein
MSANLHIAFALAEPARDHKNLIEAIKALGHWADIQHDLWYVRSELTAAAARDRLLPHLHARDLVYVIDATRNCSAWHGLDHDVARFIDDSWD